MRISNLGNKSLLAAILIGSMSLSVSAAAQDVITLKFGVYSSNKPTAMVKTFKPILNALESKMSEKLSKNVDIRLQIARSYEQGVSDLTNGNVDFSRFGPASYVEAKRENSGLRIAAMESRNAAKEFYGIIAVADDSDITDIQQLNNRSFAFGDQTSTVGRYLSQQFLAKNGIKANDLSTYEYLGRHDKVGTAVGAGDFDAGALNESTFKKLVAKGEKIRELARFPNVTKPWIARAGIDPAVFNALQASLLELKDPDTLKSLKVDGFLSGTDDDYQTIRDSIELNEKFFDESKIRTNLSQAAFDDSTDGVIQINIRLKNSGNSEGKIGSSSNPIIVNVDIDGSDEDAKVIVTQSSD